MKHDEPRHINSSELAEIIQQLKTLNPVQKDKVIKHIGQLREYNDKDDRNKSDKSTL